MKIDENDLHTPKKKSKIFEDNQSLKNKNSSNSNNSNDSIPNIFSFDRKSANLLGTNDLNDAFEVEALFKK